MKVSNAESYVEEYKTCEQTFDFQFYFYYITLFT